MDPPPKTKIFLDLKALPRDDGPPSETQLRRQKYQYFEKQCSEVAEGLFLSGDWVARNRELLADNGITHVVNCVGFICKEYFKGELDYKTFYLQGGARLQCVFSELLQRCKRIRVAGSEQRLLRQGQVNAPARQRETQGEVQSSARRPSRCRLQQVWGSQDAAWA